MNHEIIENYLEYQTTRADEKNAISFAKFGLKKYKKSQHNGRDFLYTLVIKSILLNRKNATKPIPGLISWPKWAVLIF